MAKRDRLKSGFCSRSGALLILKIAVISLSGCGTTSPPPPPPSSTPNSMEEPYRLGERVFASRQQFVETVTPRCATEEPPPAILRSIDLRVESFNIIHPEERAPGSVEIPVYFHVITNSSGTEGNISDADAQRQIEVLNVAYAGNGPGGQGAATPFRFRLVAIDRSPNDTWFNMAYNLQPTAEERAAKGALSKGGKSTLNLYTARLADRTLGWARWPWQLADRVDGVVIRYSTLPGGTSAPYDLGDTATHEVGHWLGLLHTFQGGCVDPGDEVDDTPFEGKAAGGCPEPHRDTCSSLLGEDPIDNFMDYVDDLCMFKFTPGQTSRMNDLYSIYRR